MRNKKLKFTHNENNGGGYISDPIFSKFAELGDSLLESLRPHYKKIILTEMPSFYVNNDGSLSTGDDYHVRMIETSSVHVLTMDYFLFSFLLNTGDGFLNILSTIQSQLINVRDPQSWEVYKHPLIYILKQNGFYFKKSINENKEYIIKIYIRYAW